MMKLTYMKNHPNGLKIVLACHVNDVHIEKIISSGDVPNGAELEIKDNYISQELGPNSAVLELFQSKNSFLCLEWLDWEINFQVEVVMIYLQSFKSGKEDDSLCEINVTSIDVVLYGSLLPLFVDPVKSKLLENKEKLVQYFMFLRAQSSFQEAERSYYGDTNGKSLLEFTFTPQSTISSSKYSTLNLLKVSNEKSISETLVSNMTTTSSPVLVEKIFTAKEITESRHYWESKVEAAERRLSQNLPIVPLEGERNLMITSALPYVNNVPHLGNIIGCVLSADCFARFCRIRGDNVIYICGTDEYGTATETKALSEGLTPKQICDKYHKIHSDIYKWFEQQLESQTLAAQSIFWNLYENGLIEQKSVEQLYCSKCERFLADRFVEGICPYPGCGFDDARGDQCDACGKLVNAIDLIKPRCKLCSSAPSLKSSTHLFLKLQEIEKELEDWLRQVSSQWTNNAKVICESWIRDGLKERCITRDLKWGTPVPLKGFTDKVFYVWYDAPIGYISMTMEYCKEWQKWWKNAGNISYYQFMGKDNVPFHGIIFPSCQLGTKEKWTMTTHLIATEYLNYEDGKFSKSRGIGVFGDQAKETGICSDVWRFYLLYIRPESHDTCFSWLDLQTKNNSELLNNLGNFVNRALKFVYQFYKGIVPEASPVDLDFKFMTSINQELDKYTKAIGSCKLRDGIRHLLSITRLGNQYIQENEPYKLIKSGRPEEDRIRGATVINISTNVVGLVALLLQPYMPLTSEKILKFLNYPDNLKVLPKYFCQYLNPGHVIGEPSPLIRKITDEEVEALRKRFAGSFKAEHDNSNNPVADSFVNNLSVSVAELEKKVAEQGSKVRELKSKGISKNDLSPEIKLLLHLKEKLALAQGQDSSIMTKKAQKK
ncbi:Methionine--tRNA ligase, cytoplasmic [Armadillidium vulgare]|nr:Methionine--tRNA ligase, cytoplasmic [Armadillidium vulgare]